ncbi:MAG TPA: hypothetical protein VFF73_37890 [Planctomycetota bacterium]|nr:hypothetical protein [Planctomycetota bacterium]
MTRAFLAVAMIPFFFPASVHAQEIAPVDSDSTRLPFNPFAKAKLGDWTVFETQRGGNIRPAPRPGVPTWRTTKVEGDDVTVEVVETVGGKERFRAVETFSRTEAPTLESYTRLFSSALDAATAPREISKGARKDGRATELRQALGRTFEGIKLSYQAKIGERRGKCKLWLSSEVTCSGVLQMVVDLGMASCGPGLYCTLAGFGTEGKTLFGKTVKQMTDAAGREGEGK